MSGLLPGLAFLAAGGSIAPPLIFLTILFVSSHEPLPNASALALGYFALAIVPVIFAIPVFSVIGHYWAVP